MRGHDSEIVVKTSQGLNRYGMFKFDVTAPTADLIGTALSIDVYEYSDSTDSTFTLSGIKDGSTYEDFSEDKATYSNYNLTVADPTSLIELAKIDVTGSDTGSTKVFQTQQLMDFIKADTNGYVSFWLTRDKDAKSLNSGFYSKENSSHKPALSLVATAPVAKYPLEKFVPVADPTDPANSLPVSNTYQAESGSVGGGAQIATNHSGYTGSGFIDFNSSGGYFELNGVQGGGGGSSTLFFRYALASGVRKASLVVNGVPQAISFAATGSNTTWGTLTVHVNLLPGATNCIRLLSTGQDLGNVDRMDVTAPGVGVGELLWLREDGLTIDYQRNVLYNAVGNFVDVYFAPVPLTATVNRTAPTPVQQTIIVNQDFAGNDQLIVGLNGTVSDADVYGATVWFESDGNHLVDPDELSVTTDIEGQYDKLIVDVNSLGEGVVHAAGGIDVGTGMPLVSVLTSNPSTDSFTTPLTSLSHYLQETGLSAAVALQRIRDAFGIDSTVDIGNFDHFGEALAENPTAKNVLLAVSIVQNTGSSVMELLAGLANESLSNQAVRATLSQAVYRAIANQMITDTANLADHDDLAAVTQLSAILAEQLDDQYGIDLNIDQNNLEGMIDAVAEVLAADTTRLIALANESTSGRQLVTRVNQSKKYSRTEVGPVLYTVGVGDITIDEAVELLAGTGEDDLQQVRQILLPPHMSHVDDMVVLEDHTASTVLRVFDFETPFNEVTITAESSNTRILPNDRIYVLPGQNDQERRIIVAPASDESGDVSVTLTVHDADGFTLSQAFDLNVIDVNDAPVFTAGSDQVIGTSGVPSITDWAKNISAGTRIEDALEQSLAFEVAVALGDENLFDELPVINAKTGQLTFTPSSFASGVVTVNLKLVDDGGVANGGQDSSAWQSFEIVILPAAGPQVLIARISPDPRIEAVDEVRILFDQRVTQFDLADLRLTRDGSEVSLANAALTSTDGVVWLLSGLGALTEQPGRYVLSIDAATSDIVNDAGVRLAEDAVVSWSNTIILGDANRDGVFDATDLESVLSAGRYENEEPATWAEGDWNGDGVFDSSDLIDALFAGEYVDSLAAQASPVAENNDHSMLTVGAPEKPTPREYDGGDQARLPNSV